MAASLESDSDGAVVAAIQQGDHQAFREFLRGQDRWVRGIVFAVLGDRHRVDDVTQQVWTAVWERAGELRDVRRWRPWLYRLARNAAIDAGRERSRRRRLADRLHERAERNGEVSGPAEAIVADERSRAVRAAIAALPPLYREPLTLRHLEGWSYREIADVLDVPVDTVETRLVRARRQLRAALHGKV